MVFYDILLNCENYKNKDNANKNIFLMNYLSINNNIDATKINIFDYFDKYHSFCLDLSPDKVLKGDLNFKYKYPKYSIKIIFNNQLTCLFAASVK